MTTTPSSARQTNIDNLIVALKTGATSATNIWAKLDVLHVYAAADSQAALLNWKGTSFNGSAVNSPTFTANQGFTGDGVTAYIDTGLNPTTAAGTVGFVQNSAHRSAWVRTAGTVNGPVAGAISGQRFEVAPGPPAGGNWNGRANDIDNSSYGSNGGGRVGYWLNNRPDSANKRGYRNAVAGTALAIASTGLENSNQVVLRNTSTYFNDQVAITTTGQGLVAAEITDLYNAFNTYLTAIASEGAGAQTLSPPLLTDADTFFAPTVTQGAAPSQSLSPPFLTDGDTFFDPTVTQGAGPAQDITTPLLADADSFFAPTVTQGSSPPQNVVAPFLDDAETFFAPVVTQGAAGAQFVSPGLLIDPDTFFSVTVSGPPGPILVSLSSNQSIIYLPTLTGGGAIQQPPSPQSFFVGTSAGKRGSGPADYGFKRTPHVDLHAEWLDLYQRTADQRRKLD